MTVREYWEDNAGEGCRELHLWSPQSEWSIVRHDHGLTLMSPGVSLSAMVYYLGFIGTDYCDLNYRDDSDEILEETLAACDIDAADIAALTGYVGASTR